MLRVVHGSNICLSMASMVTNSNCWLEINIPICLYFPNRTRVLCLSWSRQPLTFCQRGGKVIHAVKRHRPSHIYILYICILLPTECNQELAHPMLLDLLLLLFNIDVFCHSKTDKLLSAGGLAFPCTRTHTREHRTPLKWSHCSIEPVAQCICHCLCLSGLFLCRYFIVFEVYMHWRHLFMLYFSQQKPQVAAKTVLRELLYLDKIKWIITMTLRYIGSVWGGLV